MADAVGNKDAKNYYLDIPASDTGFFAKGLGNTDWGMKNRLSRIFDSKSGNTIMLAFDHGYIMGPTSGLERLDVTIAPLCEYADVLMGTRGAIRACIPPTLDKAVCLRATHDTSIFFEDMSVGSGMAFDMEDAFRMNASALAIQCFVGGTGERFSGDPLPCGRCRVQIRSTSLRCHSGRKRNGTYTKILWYCLPNPGRTWRKLCKDILL